MPLKATTTAGVSKIISEAKREATKKETVRFNMDMDKDLFKRLKLKSVETGRSMTDIATRFFEDGLND